MSKPFGKLSKPFVCEVCGADITLGRHSSGWQHASGKHSDHRVKKIAREEYNAASRLRADKAKGSIEPDSE